MKTTEHPAFLPIALFLGTFTTLMAIYGALQLVGGYLHL